MKTPHFGTVQLEYNAPPTPCQRDLGGCNPPVNPRCNLLPTPVQRRCNLPPSLKGGGLPPGPEAWGGKRLIPPFGEVP